MNIFELMHEICHECEKKHTKQWRIVTGYAIEMLDKICMGEFVYGTFPIDGKGVELLERQAFYIKKAVLLIEKRAGIKRDRNGGIIYECK